MTDVFAEIRNILVFALMKDESEISKHSRLSEDLGADDIDLCEFAAACEGEFSIDIPNCALAKFATVGDAVRYIESRVCEPLSASVPLVAEQPLDRPTA